MKLALIGSVAGALLGWWLGTNYVEGKWAKSENAALKQQQVLYDEAIAELGEANQRVLDQQLELANTKQDNAKREDELRQQIRESNTIELVEVEVPADCPAVHCPKPDLSERVRLFNAGINNTVPALPVTGETGSSDAGVPAADDTT